MGGEDRNIRQHPVKTLSLVFDTKGYRGVGFGVPGLKRPAKAKVKAKPKPTPGRGERFLGGESSPTKIDYRKKWYPYSS